MALKYLNINYEIEHEGDPRKTPKGKLPYIKVSGTELADSELILEYLDEISQGGLYGKLTPGEKAIGTAFARLAEDHLYWMGVASRWLDDDWFPHIVSGFFGFLPGLIRGFVSRSAQKEVKQTYHLQGLGRHTLDEQKGFARRDLQAITDIVSQHQYIVGDRLTVYDFIVAGTLSSFIFNEPPTWISDLANDYPSLKEYVDRIEKDVGVSGR